MELVNEIIKDGIEYFFLNKIVDTLQVTATKKSNGTYFLQRHDFYLKMAQRFSFSKRDSKKVLKMLEKRKLARNGSRGIIVF